MFCVGTHGRQLDEKLRISLPKSLKSFLHDGKRGYLAPGQGSFIELHNEASLKIRAEEFQCQMPDHIQRHVFERLFFSQTTAFEADNQGRLRLPSELAQHGKLHGQVYLVGTGRQWEIWDASLWDEFRGQWRFDEAHESLRLQLGADHAPPHTVTSAGNDTSGIGGVIRVESDVASDRPSPNRPR